MRYRFKIDEGVNWSVCAIYIYIYIYIQIQNKKP